MPLLDALSAMARSRPGHDEYGVREFSYPGTLETLSWLFWVAPTLTIVYMTIWSGSRWLAILCLAAAIASEATLITVLPRVARDRPWELHRWLYRDLRMHLAVIALCAFYLTLPWF